MATKKKPTPTQPERFDAAYYRDFYRSSTDKYRRDYATQIFRLIEAINGIVGGPIMTVADVGAGTGLWRDVRKTERFLTLPPSVFHTFDISDYAVKKFKLTAKLDITKETPCQSKVFDKPYHLVICSGVLAYLDDEEVDKALNNLKGATGRFLFIGELMNKEDLENGKYDMRGTDPNQHIRSVEFYGDKLRRMGFVHLAMGIWAPYSSWANPRFLAAELNLGRNTP